MDKYTPTLTTSQIADALALRNGISYDMFGRWLAGRDAFVAAKTWEEAAVFLEEYWSPDAAEVEAVLSESAGLFRERAATIRGEQA